MRTSLTTVELKIQPIFNTFFQFFHKGTDWGHPKFEALKIFLGSSHNNSRTPPLILIFLHTYWLLSSLAKKNH